MTEIRTYDNGNQVAAAAAENAVEILRSALETQGSATWVLAGGTSPMLAYKKLIVDHYDAINWSLVTVIIGDERMVPLDHKDSNWGTVMSLFDQNEYLSQVKRIEPQILTTTAATALGYQAQIQDAGISTFDLVWIGVGEDGHTLSLFPGNDAFIHESDQLVIPVYDSPKPPAERISLSLKAFETVTELVIFAVGKNKKDILRIARLKGGLPISVVADVAETNGGEVRWLYDDDAWGEV